jgi:hypothetical protein
VSPPYPVPKSALVYHITHVDNLPAILSAGGLQAKNRVPAGSHVSIAHAHIQGRRASYPVPTGPCGTLHDYVPFYCGSRSPMLFANWKQSVTGYAGGQDPIVHLVVDIVAIQGAGLPFVFTDGHAAMATSRWFTDLKDLDQIDWPLMKAKHWNDTNEDPDRKRRRQAEFLVYQQVPWSLVLGIATINQAIADKVAGMLAASAPAHRPIIKPKPEWYYR